MIVYLIKDTPSMCNRFENARNTEHTSENKVLSLQYVGGIDRGIKWKIALKT